MSAIGLVALLLRAFCTTSEVYIDPIEESIVLQCDGVEETLTEDGKVILTEPVKPFP